MQGRAQHQTAHDFRAARDGGEEHLLLDGAVQPVELPRLHWSACGQHTAQRAQVMPMTRRVVGRRKRGEIARTGPEMRDAGLLRHAPEIARIIALRPFDDGNALIEHHGSLAGQS